MKIKIYFLIKKLINYLWYINFKDQAMIIIMSILIITLRITF